MNKGVAPGDFSQATKRIYVDQMLLNDIQLEIEGYKIAWQNFIFIRKRRTGC